MNDPLKVEVLELLKGPHAHATFEEAVADFPEALRGAKPAGAVHTPWELLEHLRLSQWDILEFCRNPGHESPAWPEGYWPGGAAPSGPAAWDRSIADFLRDRAALEAMVADPEQDLLAPVPEPDGPSLLHEIFILTAHTSYHVGQILFLRRSLGA